MIHSSADIRIGDLWGKAYINNEDGVSAAIAFTSKGNEILRQCNCELREHPFSLVAEGQMKASPLKKKWFEKIQKSLKDKNIIIEDIYEMYMKIHKIDYGKSV